jgi:hypothetical protein
MYRKVIIVSVFLCTLLSGCNSNSEPTRTIGDLSLEEQTMLYSPTLNINTGDLGRSELAPAATCLAGVPVNTIEKGKAPRRVGYYYQSDMDKNFNLGENQYAMQYIRLKMVFAKENQARGGGVPFCWLSANQVINIDGRSIGWELFGKFADIGVTTQLAWLPYPGTTTYRWTPKNFTLTFTYRYSGGQYEALINADVLKGYLIRVNRPTGDKTKILDYPMMGAWRGDDSFNNMFSFAPVAARRLSIVVPESLGLQPLAVSTSASINLPNTPMISIKDSLNSMGGEITALGEQRCEQQRLPGDPCPGDPPKTVVPTTPPPSTQPEPKTCTKQNCSQYLGTSIWGATVTVAGAFGTVGSVMLAIPGCTVAAMTLVGCGGPVVGAIGSIDMMVVGTQTQINNTQRYNECLIANAACKP